MADSRHYHSMCSKLHWTYVHINHLCWTCMSEDHINIKLTVLSIVAAIPGAFFFFIFASAAFFVMRAHDRKKRRPRGNDRVVDITYVMMNATFLIFGLTFCLGLGSWASIRTYVEALEDGQAQAPFSCQPLIAPALEEERKSHPQPTSEPYNELIWGEDEWEPMAASGTSTASVDLPLET